MGGCMLKHIYDADVDVHLASMSKCICSQMAALRSGSMNSCLLLRAVCLPAIYIGVNYWGAGTTGTLPSSWGEPGAWPHLEQLLLGANQLTGRLLDSWPQSLQTLHVPNNMLTGSLPSALSALPQLRSLSLEGNYWTGELPSDWNTPHPYSQLYALYIGSPYLTGTLPSSWGNLAFPNLQLMALIEVPQVHGTLPESWASQDSFSSLQALYLDAPSLHGTLPRSWASHEAFKSLQMMVLLSTSLQGKLPAFDNTNLGIFALIGSLINSSLIDLWSSSAPLSILHLYASPICGSLPDVPGLLPQLVFLSLRETNIQGTVPLSWLQAGGLLSHVSYLTLDNVWEDSVADTDWRQRLCLNQDLYGPDVTGKQIAGLPDLRQALLATDDSSELSPGLNSSAIPSWLQESTAFSSLLVAGQLYGTNNQLASIGDICANHSSRKILLIAWLVFGGCCLIIVALYACLSKYRHRATALSPRLRSLLTLVSVPYETLSGLGGLAFYYYDLVTNTIVLTQVWGKWPGHVLIAIFFFHFALTGCVVVYHGLVKYVLAKPDVFLNNRRAVVWLALLAFATSPINIPLVVVLDTVAFLRQLLLCSKHLVQLTGLKWLQPGHVAVARLHNCIYVGDFLGLSWVDLDNYENMHNLVAAMFQSLPTAILNSLLFSLGNKPSHGVFLSNKLFVATVVASCLAMLKSMIVVLWHAHQQDVLAVRYVVNVVVGQTSGRRELEGSLQSNASIELLVERYRTSGSAPLGTPDMP